MEIGLILGAGQLAATLRLAAPLTFAALGGVISERSGVVNIALEGIMLMGAFFAVWGTAVTGNAWAGLLIGIAAGVVLTAVHAYAAIHLRSDQIVSGMALNILALGLTSFLNFQLYGFTGTPADLAGLPDVDLGPVRGIPYVGGVIDDQSVLVWLAVALVVGVHLVLFRTVAGMRLRAVGEHPRAADTLGIDVFKMRYAAVLASGVLAAIGGAYLSLEVSHSFTNNITSGRGFIGLAAMIFGNWTPVGAFIAALLFGFGDALTFSLQGTGVPVQLLGTLPYLLTILAVGGLLARTRPPAADGVPYETEGR
jgi:simple sugar transport system permease protein